MSDSLDKIIGKTCLQIESFDEKILSKPHDFQGNDEDTAHLVKFISFLKSNQKEISKLKDSRKAHIDQSLQTRLDNAIDKIINKLAPEQSSIEQVALSAILELQSLIQKMSVKDTTWLKRGKKTEKADMDGLEDEE